MLILIAHAHLKTTFFRKIFRSRRRRRRRSRRRSRRFQAAEYDDDKKQ